MTDDCQPTLTISSLILIRISANNTNLQLDRFSKFKIINHEEVQLTFEYEFPENGLIFPNSRILDFHIYGNSDVVTVF